MDASSHKVIRPWSDRVETVDWSPYGRRLLCVGLDGRLIVLDSDGRGKRRGGPPDRIASRTYDWSSEAEHLSWQALPTP
jgi:hypothetical protein